MTKFKAQIEFIVMFKDIFQISDIDELKDPVYNERVQPFPGPESKIEPHS